jgi:hypothetical protein
MKKTVADRANRQSPPQPEVFITGIVDKRNSMKEGVCNV